MSRNPALMVLLALAIVFGGGAMLAQHWDAIENENNAFAKDCNDRGGMVIFGANVRQCLAARPTKESK